MADAVACPACSRALQVPSNLLGQQVKCPACGETFTASTELETVNWRKRQEERNAVDELPEEREPTKPLRMRDDDEDRDRDDRDRDRRPLRRRSRDDDEDDDRRSRRRRKPATPGKAQAVAIMTLIGGIVAVLLSLVLMLTCIGLLWPGTYFSLVCGIFCIIKGAQLLGDYSHLESPPQVHAILQIINIINLDLINLTMGILNLVFINDPEVKGYYRG